MSYEPIDIATLMKDSYGEYAVATFNRALPSAIDGLKAVQRRILQIGLDSDFTGLVKTVRWAGQVLGRLHPHADTAITDAMYNMVDLSVQPYCWLVGHGNFGGFSFATRQRVGNYKGAAARYTEVKLAPYTKAVFDEVATYRRNFDGTYEEVAEYVPALPVLALNGAIGIGVGYATTTIGYNAHDVAKVLKQHLSGKPMLKAVQSARPIPSFTSGCSIADNQGYADYVSTGRGTMLLQGKWEYIKAEHCIDITALPLTDAESYAHKVANAVKAGLVHGIRSIEDLSGSTIQVRLHLHKKANPDEVVAKLLANTPLQDTFKGNCTALVNGLPKELGLAELLSIWLEARKVALNAKHEALLIKLEAELAKIEAVAKALVKLDEVIALIRKNKDKASARKALCELLGVTDEEAKAILAISLGQLVSTEMADLEAKHEALLADKANYSALLEPEALSKYISDEVVRLAKEVSNTPGTACAFADLSKKQAQKLRPQRSETDFELMVLQGGQLPKAMRRSTIANWYNKRRDKKLPLREAWYKHISGHCMHWGFEAPKQNFLDRISYRDDAEELRQQFNTWCKAEKLPPIKKQETWLNALWRHHDDPESIKLEHVANHRK